MALNFFSENSDKHTNLSGEDVPVKKSKFTENVARQVLELQCMSTVTEQSFLRSLHPKFSRNAHISNEMTVIFPIAQKHALCSSEQQIKKSTALHFLDEKRFCVVNVMIILFFILVIS